MGIRTRVLDSWLPCFPVTESTSCSTKADSMTACVHAEMQTHLSSGLSATSLNHRNLDLNHQDLDLCLSEGGTLLDSSFALRQRDTSQQRVFSTSGTQKLGILVKPHQTVLYLAIEKLPRRISLVKFISLLLYRSAMDSTTQNRKPLPSPRATKSSGPPGFCSAFFMTHL